MSQPAAPKLLTWVSKESLSDPATRGNLESLRRRLGPGPFILRNCRRASIHVDATFKVWNRRSQEERIIAAIYLREI